MNKTKPSESDQLVQEVTFGQEAHTQLLQGAEILYRAVKSTMGPSGHNVIIDNGQTAPLSQSTSRTSFLLLVQS